MDGWIVILPYIILDKIPHILSPVNNTTHCEDFNLFTENSLPGNHFYLSLKKESKGRSPKHRQADG